VSSNGHRGGSGSRSKRGEDRSAPVGHGRTGNGGERGATSGPTPRLGSLWADGVRKDLWERILLRLREPPYELRPHEAARRGRTFLNGLLEIGLVQLEDPRWTHDVCERGRRLRVDLTDPDPAAVEHALDGTQPPTEHGSD